MKNKSISSLCAINEFNLFERKCEGIDHSKQENAVLGRPAG